MIQVRLKIRRKYWLKHQALTVKIPVLKISTAASHNKITLKSLKSTIALSIAFAVQNAKCTKTFISKAIAILVIASVIASAAKQSKILSQTRLF